MIETNGRPYYMPRDAGPFQVTVFDRGNRQWVKVLSGIGLFDFEVWRGRLAHGDLWSILHRLETGVPFASPFRFRAVVPIPFSPVHSNQGNDRRFLVIHRDGVEALVLYCVSSSIPHALHIALVQAWSHDPDAGGQDGQGHRQDLRRHPEGAAGAVPGEGFQPGQDPVPDLDQAARRTGIGRPVTPPRKRLSRYTPGTIPADIREEVLAEMKRPELAHIRTNQGRIYRATVNVKKRRGKTRIGEYHKKRGT